MNSKESCEKILSKLRSYKVGRYNITTIKLTNSTLSDKYRDFIELFVNKTLEETLLAHQH